MKDMDKAVCPKCNGTKEVEGEPCDACDATGIRKSFAGLIRK